MHAKNNEGRYPHSAAPSPTPNLSYKRTNYTPWVSTLPTPTVPEATLYLAHDAALRNFFETLACDPSGPSIRRAATEAAGLLAGARAQAALAAFQGGMPDKQEADGGVER